MFGMTRKSIVQSIEGRNMCAPRYDHKVTGMEGENRQHCSRKIIRLGEIDTQMYIVLIAFFVLVKHR
jgi:hypothetical protein